MWLEAPTAAALLKGVGSGSSLCLSVWGVANVSVAGVDFGACDDVGMHELLRPHILVVAQTVTHVRRVQEAGGWGN